MIKTILKTQPLCDGTVLGDRSNIAYCSATAITDYRLTPIMPGFAVFIAVEIKKTVMRIPDRRFYGDS